MDENVTKQNPEKFKKAARQKSSIPLWEDIGFQGPPKSREAGWSFVRSVGEENVGDREHTCRRMD